MDLKQLFGYEGKNVVVFGAASGMGKAATELLLHLGANVYAVDINETALPVKKALKADLGDKDNLDHLAKELPETIYALFSCHGIAGYSGKELQVQKVNFLSHQYLTELLLPRIADHGSVTFISSVGGFGWQAKYRECLEVINQPTWEDAIKWYENHPDIIKDSYCFAKQCMLSYVADKCTAPEFIDRRIRLNAICPGDTTTGLTDDFNKASSPTGKAEDGAKAIAQIFLSSWNGYPARSEEMGYPLVVVGSEISSYMSGQAIYIDFGLTKNWEVQSLLSATNDWAEHLKDA